MITADTNIDTPPFSAPNEFIGKELNLSRFLFLGFVFQNNWSNIVRGTKLLNGAAAG
jgi:hypothetical protein